MGLFGGDSKKTTNTTDNSVGITDLIGSDVVNISGVKLGGGSGGGFGSLRSGGGETNSINILDGGAIEKSFNFAESSNAHAYDFSRDVAKNATASVSEAVKAVSESARTETENIFINLQKYALYGALIWGAVQIFKGVK